MNYFPSLQYDLIFFLLYGKLTNAMGVCSTHFQQLTIKYPGIKGDGKRQCPSGWLFYGFAECTHRFDSIRTFCVFADFCVSPFFLQWHYMDISLIIEICSWAIECFVNNIFTVLNTSSNIRFGVCRNWPLYSCWFFNEGTFLSVYNQIRTASSISF